MEGPLLNKLGDKIFYLREQRGISQEDLSKILGVARQTVSKWEANVMQPKLARLKQIAEYFQVSVEYFVGDSTCADVKENVKSESESINENEEIEEGIACDSIDVNSTYASFSNNEKNKNKLTRKTKLTIVFSVIAVVLILSVILVAIGFNESTLKEQGTIEEEASSLFNFSLENVGWAIFSIVLTSVLIISIIIVFNIIKYKSKRR